MQKLFFPIWQSLKIEKQKPLSLIEQSLEIEKRKPFFLTKQNLEIEIRKLLSPIEHSLEIENLVIQLTTLLKNWDKSPNVNIIQLRENFTPKEEKDSIRILATKINSTNAIYHDQFTNSTQFDVK